ncbi:dihydroxyacetone kinase phosphoryl donor subunit DhaM [Paraoerskovia marina]|uniref:Phosphocarrier protein HPr n=1 Tax=Paraoerskovia marina TaxID=545619 RepID=A0A1H1U3Q0_9CELL|nr:dihydroxyacetone kinase phosphoryl donor subunit DhaM [Paraoerskovia marina]SDS67140.1 PTS hybrid protein [Paraoerskovia marina]
MSRVSLVLVSHSAALADGLAELAGQMAPGVRIVPVGGADDRRLGTSFDRILEALTDVTSDGGSAVVLADLGSAVLTVESVLDLEDGLDVRLAGGPFVEGAVAAAVAAHGGLAASDVVAAAENAAVSLRGAPVGSEYAVMDATTDGAAAADGEIVVVLRNPLGLHARPAAVLARMIAGFDAQVRVDGVDGASVLELMKLGATQGRELTIVAEGPQAAEARQAVVEAVEAGFGEL